LFNGGVKQTMKKSKLRLATFVLGVMAFIGGAADSRSNVLPEIAPDKIFVTATALMGIAAGIKHTTSKKEARDEDE
jgi:disulfide bond formation protein DsbB